jgi:hypothetical protein
MESALVSVSGGRERRYGRFIVTCSGRDETPLNPITTIKFYLKSFWSRLRFDQRNNSVLNCLMFVALVLDYFIYKLVR